MSPMLSSPQDRIATILILLAAAFVMERSGLMDDMGVHWFEFMSSVPLWVATALGVVFAIALFFVPGRYSDPV